MRAIVHQSQTFLRTHWLAVTSGVLILSASLIHVPASWDALNYFDPPKRLLWALMALVLAGAWSARATRLRRTPLIVSLALLAWIVLHSVSKPQPDAELEVLVTWVLPLLLFVLASGRASTAGLKIVGSCLVAAGALQAVIMVLQRFGFDPFFFDSTSVMDYKPGRMVGTIGYQNQAVDFLALSAAGVFVVTQSLSLRLALTLPMFVVAGLTGNRGGLVAFAFALCVSLAVPVVLHRSWSSRRKLSAAAGVSVGVCGLFAVLMLIPETGSRFREFFGNARQSPAICSRVVMARVALDMFRDKPWTGWGAGEYAFQYLDRLGTVLPTEKTHDILRSVVFAREAHNDFLQFAAEFGIVGILLLSAILGCAVIRVTKGRDTPTGSVAAMTFVLAYMAVSSLVSFPWQTSMAGPLAGFLVGWLWTSGDESEHGKTVALTGSLPRAWGRIAKAVLGVMSVAVVGWVAFDAFLNTAIPDALPLHGPSAAERLLPRCAYRYHALVGASYAAQGVDLEAEAELILAQRGYRDIPLWNNLGHVHARLNKWREAREVYEQWARCGLDHKNALLNLSIASEQTGRLREAAECLVKKNALWSDPPVPQIKRLAVLQLQSGDPKRAQETLRMYRRKWAKADSKRVAEIENLEGGIWLVLGDREKAANCFRSALDKNPELESAKRNLEAMSGVGTQDKDLGGQEKEEKKTRAPGFGF